MNVLSVAFPFAPVRPETPGGAEQVLLELDKWLMAAGHNSIVVAAEGSEVNGSLIPVSLAEGEIGAEARKRAHEQMRAAINAARGNSDIDIVHMHGLDFYEYMPNGVPVLVTLHLPLSWYPEEALKERRPHIFFNCVSASQACTATKAAGRFDYIENGVGLDGYPEKSPGHYVLSMGRICPEKGFHIAIDASKKAGLPFVLAGAVFRYRVHEEYYQKEIATRLGPNCAFIGPQGSCEKKKLLSDALCLVAPSLVHETSSLVAMEALASGTPVVAFPHGALADIVEHGRTGFLVNGIEDMAEAIKACADIDPTACMEAARQRFSSKAMAKRYLEKYGKILGMRTENECR